MTPDPDLATSDSSDRSTFLLHLSKYLPETECRIRRLRCGWSAIVVRYPPQLSNNRCLSHRCVVLYAAPVHGFHGVLLQLQFSLFQYLSRQATRVDFAGQPLDLSNALPYIGWYHPRASVSGCPVRKTPPPKPGGVVFLCRAEGSEPRFFSPT